MSAAGMAAAMGEISLVLLATAACIWLGLTFFTVARLSRAPYGTASRVSGQTAVVGLAVGGGILAVSFSFLLLASGFDLPEPSPATVVAGIGLAAVGVLAGVAEAHPDMVPKWASLSTRWAEVAALALLLILLMV